jgi:hypothetical protein
MTANLTLAHLYPDLMRTYGDRGNVMALASRARWRGIDVDVVGVTRAERIPAGADLVLIGGGTDRAQETIGEDLRGRREELRDLCGAGTVVVGICGGYQFLGHRYVDADGVAIEGLGLLDVTTVAGQPRIIGNVRAAATFGGRSFELFGFENHGGRTTLGSGATPLATVGRGQGNNGRDRTEGAVQGSIVGTYLHGPVLPTNPAFADALLARALAAPGRPDAALAELDDRLEDEAHRLARARKR